VALALTIGGVSKTMFLGRFKTQNLTIEYTLGARGRLTCDVIDRQADTATAYRPTTDQAIVVADGATTFAGTITRVSDAPIAEPRTGVITRVGAVDRWRAASARLVNKTYAAGQTLKAIVSDLVTTHLATGPYAITLDPGMANGPTMGVVSCDYATVETVFARLSDLTGWAHRLTPASVLEMFSVGTKAAAFSLTSANASVRGAIEWSKTRAAYVNRQFVRAGTATQVQKTWLVTGDGATSTWTLVEYPGVQYPNGGLVVTSLLVNDSALGALLPIGIVGTDATAYYNYNPATNQVVRALGNLPNLATASMTYLAQFPIVVSAEDAGEIATNGPWEAMAEAPEMFDRTEAETLAAGLLRRYKVIPREIIVRTAAGFSLPGDVVTITIPERTISGSWLITATRIVDEPNGSLLYEYTCLEGVEAQASWIDFWREAVTSAAGGGAVSVSGTGAGAGGSVARTAFFLGGSGLDAVRSPTPTWVPASGGGAIGQAAIQVRLNTATRGTTAATVIARLRIAAAAAVSVQARLYNVTDSVAIAGTSDVVTSTTWTTVVFSVTLASGDKDYELQLLPGAAHQDVFGTGHIE
jgi:hypothetical protein